MNPLKDSAFHRAGVTAAIERTEQDDRIAFIRDFSFHAHRIPSEALETVLAVKERVLRASQETDYQMPVNDMLLINNLLE